LQLGGQPVGHQRRLGGVRVTQHDVGEAHHRGREQRHRDVAADLRLEAGHAADLGYDRAAHGFGRNQLGGSNQRADAGREHGRNDEA
jgi:hypothetical protein